MRRILIAVALLAVTCVCALAQDHAHHPLAQGGITEETALPERCYDQQNPNFSEYSFCHFELHELGFIRQILEQTRPNNCCDGSSGGECRMTIVDLTKDQAYIAHQWQGFVRKKVKIVPVQGLRVGFAIVCAGQYLYESTEYPVYCIGVPSGM